MTDSDNPRRVLLKLSGEAFGGGKVGIDTQVIRRIAEEIVPAVQQGVQVAIVVGGGNFFRGAELSQRGMDRGRADYMGMLATVMNALALADAMDKQGLTARVMSAIGIEQVVEPYVRPKALQYLEEGKVVVFAAGTGNPFFTTDTAAALRGAEIGAEVVLKATKVDGVYTADLRQRVTPSWRLMRPSVAIWASWMPRLLRCAVTRSCPSACFPSSSPALCCVW